MPKVRRRPKGWSVRGYDRRTADGSLIIIDDCGTSFPLHILATNGMPPPLEVYSTFREALAAANAYANQCGGWA